MSASRTDRGVEARSVAALPKHGPNCHQEAEFTEHGPRCTISLGVNDVLAMLAARTNAALVERVEALRAAVLRYHREWLAFANGETDDIELQTEARDEMFLAILTAAEPAGPMPDSEAFDEAGNMCPNCVTPWKCNGPHLPELTRYGAAEPAGEQGTALDVDRLYRALVEVDRTRGSGDYPHFGRNIAAIADVIAAAYRAAAPPKTRPAASQGEGGVTE
jgi:hypothetical protein